MGLIIRWIKSLRAEQTYSVAEAAALMSVSRQRIHQWRQENRIDAIWDGAYWRILEHSIGHVRPSARPVGRPQKRIKK